MLRVDVASPAQLRAAASALAWSRSDRFRVALRSGAGPGPLGPLPGLRRHDLRREGDAVTVRLRFTEPVPFQLVAGAVLALCGDEGRPPLAPVSPDIAAYGELPAWLPPARNVAPLVGAAPDLTVIRPYDQLVPGGEPPTVDSIAPASSVDDPLPSVSVVSEAEPAAQDYPDVEFIPRRGDLRAAYARARGTVIVVTDGEGFEDPSYLRKLVRGAAGFYSRAALDRELTPASGPAVTAVRSDRSS